MADGESGPEGPVGSGRPVAAESCVKPAMIGCGAGLVVALVIVGVMMFLGGEIRRFIAEQSQRARLEQVFAENWDAPPATAPIAAFTPEQVGDYSLKRVDRAADFPALGIKLEGYHAVYDNEDSDVIDVAVYRVDEQGKTAVFDEVESRVDDDERFPGHRLTRMPNVLDFQVTKPTTLAGRFWYGQGWLVFIRSDSPRPIGSFSRLYLEKVAQGAKDSQEAGDGETAEQGAEISTETG